MLLTTLFIIEFMVAGVLAFAYGRKQEAKRLKDYWDNKIYLIEAEVSHKKYNLYEKQQVDELLFLLTDFMHDQRVFEVFSKQEISDLFVDARMVTRYNRQHTLEDVEKFIKRLQENELSKLYPGYYQSLRDQNT